MESFLIVYSSYSSIRSREWASRIPPRTPFERVFFGLGASCWLMLGHFLQFFGSSFDSLGHLGLKWLREPILFDFG